MKNGFIVVGGAVLMIGAAASCSSGPAPGVPETGALPAGAAQLTINGQDAGTTEAVQCALAETLTTIKAGDDTSGATMMVSNAKELTVESVSLRNLNGFTGGYNHGLEGTARVAMTGPTYDITGTAMGYNSARPSERTTETFTIRVSC